MPKLTRLMFRLMGMNVFKVEKNGTLLESRASAVDAATNVCCRFERD